MTEPLVDREGYPLSTIDVYQVRHARHQIKCKYFNICWWITVLFFIKAIEICIEYDVFILCKSKCWYKSNGYHFLFSKM